MTTSISVDVVAGSIAVISAFCALLFASRRRNERMRSFASESAQRLRKVETELELLRAENASLRADLVKAQNTTAEMTRSRAAFVATVSHDIRTPLNAVVGFSEFLDDPDCTEEDRKLYINGIVKSSRTLLSLVDGVLDLSGIESGRIELKGGECGIRHLFAQMESSFSGKAANKGLALKFEIAGDIPLLAIREDRLGLILTNLIENGIKFTARGEVCCRASWTADSAASTGTLTLKVSDTGIGIAPEKFDAIFDPLRGAEGRRMGNVYRGAGLGLPICKRMVQTVGGTVSLSSEIGIGSEFTVELPRVETLGAEIFSEPIRISMPEKDRSGNEVYLVDDVPMNLLVLRRYVESRGIPPQSVRAFRGVAEALSALRASVSASGSAGEGVYILTDMWMPGMSGEDLAEVVRGDDRFKKVKIVAVTADSDPSGTFDMSLFDAVLTKPVTSEKVAEIFP